MDKEMLTMFELLHQENLLIFNRLGVESSIIEEINTYWLKYKIKAREDNQDAN